MAIFTANLKAKAFTDNLAPLTFKPICYLKESCRLAQQKEMLDAPLQASASLLRIGMKAPHNVNISDVHTPLIDTWLMIVQGYYIAGKGEIGNAVLSDMLGLLHHLLRIGHFQYRYILDDMLKKFSAMVRIALASEKVRGLVSPGLSLAPYDTSNQKSLVHLIESATSLIKKKDDKGWLSPYREFMDINEMLHEHFRELADNADFGDSFLLWHIITSLKYIAKIYLQLIQKPVTDAHNHIEDLAMQLDWYVAFFWVTFSKTKKVNIEYAKQACDVMAWIALSFLKELLFENVKTCIGNIHSIIDSYGRSEYYRSPYDMADLFMCLWKVRIYAEERHQKFIVEYVDKYFDQKPDGLKDDQWKEVLGKIERRKVQLNESIGKGDMFAFNDIRDNASSLLKKLLRDNINEI